MPSLRPTPPRGFTLIELMMVIAIIGILAAVAVPMYKRYTINAHFVNVLSVMMGDKVRLSTFRGEHGRWPTPQELTNENPPLSKAGIIEFVVADPILTRIDGGANVQLDYTVKVKTVEGALQLVSTVREGSTTWNCSSSDIPKHYLPRECR